MDPFVQPHPSFSPPLISSRTPSGRWFLSKCEETSISPYSAAQRPSMSKGESLLSQRETKGEHDANLCIRACDNGPPALPMAASQDGLWGYLSGDCPGKLRLEVFQFPPCTSRGPGSGNGQSLHTRSPFR